jgi:hypothetical protein
MWNELVMVINYDKVSQEDENHARLLLKQLDTAGGRHLMRKEITYFLEDMYEKYGNIPKITLEQELINLKNEYNKYKTKPFKGYAKLDGIRYSNINESVCYNYEMRIQELERKIKSL